MKICSIISILTDSAAPSDDGRASVAMAVFLAIVGLLVLFFVIVALLRISFRGPRRQDKATKSNLDLDAWREAGDRIEPFDDQDHPIG